MASIVRATVRLPFINGMPKDVSENVFWFGMPQGGSIDTAADLLFPSINSFYADGASGHLSVSGYLASYVDRTKCEIDFAEVESTTGHQLGYPRILPMTGLDTPASASLPAEVALCLSFGGNDPNIPKASSRGRVYIGPFSTGAMSSATGYSRPAQALIDAMCYGATTYLAAAQLGFYPWYIYSRKLRLATLVLGGVVDNEWDTQRRRGEEANSRTFWTLPPE